MEKSSKPLKSFISSYVDITKDESVWQSWLNLKSQEWRDLVALIKSNVRDEFKMRAIAILLVPHRGCLPFEWRDSSSLSNNLFLYGHKDLIRLHKLSEKLQSFTAGLILYSTLEVLKYWKHDNNVYSSLTYYDRYIIDFLKILPEDSPMAEKLFSVYQLNDPIPFSGMDDSSGYNPLYPILNEDIPEKWKKLADARMREIISAEARGQLKPRAEHEEALKWYLYHITLALYSDNHNIRYSPGLFASQLTFVLGLPNINNRGLFNSHQIADILRIIEGDEYKNLRHRLARHIVLENTKEFERFYVSDRGTRRAVKALLNEFGSDRELASALQRILAEAEERSKKYSRESSTQMAKERNVLDQMA